MSTDPIEAPSIGVGDGEVAVAETADAIDLDLYPNEASDLAVVPGGLALIIHWVRKPDWSIVVGDLRLLC
jgi:hypothetical protein